MGQVDSLKEELAPDDEEEITADGNVTETGTRTEQEVDQDPSATAATVESDEKDEQNLESDPEPGSESTREDFTPFRTDSEMDDQLEPTGEEQKLADEESVYSLGGDEASEEGK